MAALTQTELDALCCGGDGDGVESPPSPIDNALRGAKRRRRITLTAMGAEIDAMLQDGNRGGIPQPAMSDRGEDGLFGGLPQRALDDLSVGEDTHEGPRSGSPLGSSLYRARRGKKRPSTSGPAAAIIAVAPAGAVSPPRDPRVPPAQRNRHSCGGAAEANLENILSKQEGGDLQHEKDLQVCGIVSPPRDPRVRAARRNRRSCGGAAAEEANLENIVSKQKGGGLLSPRHAARRALSDPLTPVNAMYA